MTSFWSPLRRPRYLALATLVTVALSVVYYFLSTRSGGTNPNSIFNTTSFSTPDFIIAGYGFGWFSTMVALDFIIAAMSGILIAVSVANYRTRRLAGASTICSLAIATATFTCPACSLPVAATLGVVIIGSSLPLFGLGFQFLTFLILFATILWLSRQMRNQM